MGRLTPKERLWALVFLGVDLAWLVASIGFVVWIFAYLKANQ